MYTCKDCQYYSWSNKDLKVKCKKGVNIDELYRVNNHKMTRRKCKKYKRKGGVIMNDIIKENLEKIQDISELKDDWNGNGASAFNDTLIQKMKYLILRLNIQPEIFPTARGSIQFEYEKETGEYLEFELFDTKLKVLTMGSDGNNYSCDMNIDIEEINKVIDEFYG